MAENYQIISKNEPEYDDYIIISKNKLPVWLTRSVNQRDGTKFRLPLFDHYTTLDHFQTRRIKSRIAHEGHTEGKPDTEEVIYISQPYGPLSMDTFKEMIRICEENNIEFEIRGDSDHYISRTIMIEWRKKE